jgi:hypothetical protein
MNSGKQKLSLDENRPERNATRDGLPSFGFFVSGCSTQRFL